MFCKNCGQELSNNAVICPHCGIATDNLAFTNTVNGAAKSVQQKTNGFAIAGMICAIVGMLVGIYFFCIPSIVGLVLSIVGMVKVKEYNSGFGFALAGIIVAGVSLLIWLLFWIFLFGCSWFNFIWRLFIY